MYGQGHNPSAPAGHLPLHKGGFAVAVGASIARPQNLARPRNCTGEQCLPLRLLTHWCCREGLAPSKVQGRYRNLIR